MIDRTRASGVAAMRFAGRSSSLEASDSLVVDNVAAGVSVHGSDAKLRRCSVRQTDPNPDGKWGDGISLTTREWVPKPGSSPLEPVLSPSVESNQPSSLDMTDCLVDRSARVGLLFDGSGGRVQRSVFTRGMFSIVLQRGADVEIAKDNVTEDNQEDSPAALGTDSSVEPSPLPGIAIPRL